MEAVLESISNWFLVKQDYFIAFAEADSRLEGWFKAELLLLFPKLMKVGLLDEFDREYNVKTLLGRKQIDFRLLAQGEINYCEVKALCISQAAGTPRNLAFYFRNDHIGLIKKLDALPSGTRWVLGFVYPNPGAFQWSTVVESLPDSLNHWRCLTSPGNYPEYLFISIWRSQATTGQ
ncbi:hypothetical protein ES707_19472 [subsurface metagenome]